MLRSLWIVLLLMVLSQSFFAQQRFKAGISLGINAAQINGDEHAGFNKLGLMGGLNAAAVLGEKSEFGIGILYSQRGSQSTFFPNSGIAPSKIQLDYVEVPLTYTFMDWQANEGDYYRMHFHGGFSYGRLISSRADDAAVLIEDFNQNDVGFIVGVTYFTSEHFGLTFRYNRSIIPLKSSTDNSNAAFWSFFLTFNATYVF